MHQHSPPLKKKKRARNPQLRSNHTASSLRLKHIYKHHIWYHSSFAFCGGGTGMFTSESSPSRSPATSAVRVCGSFLWLMIFWVKSTRKRLSVSSSKDKKKCSLHQYQIHKKQPKQREKNVSRNVLFECWNASKHIPGKSPFVICS